MKKISILLLSLLIVLVLAACGDGEETSTGSEDSPSESNNESVEPAEEANTDDVYFKDNEAMINDLKIKIAETKVIPAGEQGNEYGDKPVFAIWYETTNLTDKDIDPSTAWFAVFTAIQDNDPNAINELEVGSLPDESHLDSQLETIKKDGTVESSIAYELDDLETPVTLVATQGLMGEELGRADYEIK
ncbi:DUF5067 domain-containing protein [Oceanobacillus arenosus]|uniref:DUF5067 domain-containing protein n=1 Tax=Oceanobacillus arenosus TaxID=1229153 RepID=A0A3D8PY00_9BACI|nr:DUF5067 domain-containing protein [Oceanobacillus arenosus]RDW21026.1 DUF5067 domain-containing protein [Oceanobacillus arenosus]